MSSSSTYLFLFFFTVILNNVSVGQDTINLMNGKTLVVKDLMFEDPKLSFSGIYSQKKVKLKQGTIEFYRTFSVTDAKGVETVLYRQDSALGEYRSETEMRYFVYGEQHAHTHYKPMWAAGIAGGVSLAISLFDTYNPKQVITVLGDTIPSGMLRSEPSIIHVLVPFVVTSLIGLPKVRLRLSEVKDRALVNDENFLTGYARIARQKKLFHALGGSLAGVATGLFTYYLFKP